MSRSPDVDPALIREILSEDVGAAGGRPTSTEVAATIAKLIGKPLSANLIRSAIRRHPEWDEIPEAEQGRPPLMMYAVDAALGPIEKEHLGSHHRRKMTAWERVTSGNFEIGGSWLKQVTDYVEYRIDNGRVTDYDPDTGFDTRYSYPWEFGHYYRQVPPSNARVMIADLLAATPGTESYVMITIQGVEATLAHLEFWKTAFEIDQPG